jgi:hypothetical protein
MEWFIPSIVVVLLGAVVFFLVLPRLAPYILGVLALLFFVIGAWQHYNMFPYEYSSSVLRGILSDYTPFIMLIAVIFGGMVALMTAFGMSPPAIADVIPPLVPAANNSKANNAGILGNMFKPANNSKANNAGVLGNMFKPANNPKANNGGILGNMFKPANNSKKNLASTSFMTV